MQGVDLTELQRTNHTVGALVHDHQVEQSDGAAADQIRQRGQGVPFNWLPGNPRTTTSTGPIFMMCSRPAGDLRFLNSGWLMVRTPPSAADDSVPGRAGGADQVRLGANGAQVGGGPARVSFASIQIQGVSSRIRRGRPSIRWVPSGPRMRRGERERSPSRAASAAGEPMVGTGRAAVP